MASRPFDQNPKSWKPLERENHFKLHLRQPEKNKSEMETRSAGNLPGPRAEKKIPPKVLSERSRGPSAAAPTAAAPGGRAPLGALSEGQAKVNGQGRGGGERGGGGKGGRGAVKGVEGAVGGVEGAATSLGASIVVWGGR